MFQQPNLKYYILISGVILIILVFLVSLPLFQNNVKNEPINSFPAPTSIEVDRTTPIPPTIEIGAFTGGLFVTLEPQEAKFVNEKKDLRLKTPLTLSTFSIDFDYGEDRFTVTLNTPKDQSLNEFRDWLNKNYSNLPLGEFILK